MEMFPIALKKFTESIFEEEFTTSPSNAFPQKMIPKHRGFGATRRMRGIRKKQSELGFCFLLVAATPVLWLLVFFFILFFSQTKRFHLWPL